jgi:hypothetical protein
VFIGHKKNNKKLKIKLNKSTIGTTIFVREKNGGRKNQSARLPS